MLLNAQLKSETLPHFALPKLERLAAIRAGWVVKVGSNGELFWVMITSALDSGALTGRVDNHLLHPANRMRWPYGCTIELSRDHVLDAQCPLDRDAFLAAGCADRDLVIQVDSTQHRPCAGGQELFQKYWQHLLVE